MRNKGNTRLPRHNWSRIALPPGLFKLLNFVAQAKGYDEKTVHKLLLDAIQTAYPNDWERWLPDIEARGWLDWLEWSDRD